jgi:hypothetical protein
MINQAIGRISKIQNNDGTFLDFSILMGYKKNKKLFH